MRAIPSRLLRGCLHGGRKIHPRRRINFSFALHAEISAELVAKWRRKRRITRPLAAESPAPCTRIFRAKVVNKISLHGARIFLSLS